jgi:dTDP-4-dehydrorhamnose 3,5-epimerase
MKIINTKFKDLLIIQHVKNTDKRGYLREIYNNKILKSKFVFEYYVQSKKSCLRGLHFQYKFQQSKFVTVIKGKILDVVIDLRKNSKTYGKTFSIILSEANCKSLFVPRGFAHSYFTYDKLNIVYYKQDNYWMPKYESGIIWNDKELNIKWPKGKKILSKKDCNLQSFKQFKNNFKYL